MMLPGFPLGQSFADTDDRLKRGIQYRAHPAVDGRIGFAEVLAALRMTDNDHPAADILAASGC